ncbi:serologically defined colon cancer antigen 8 homolog isoform X3 [Periplaneta americana]|uniref:serologically defined colon cancer antigen 8 homolog isoform X3 n=1 Tax=Periplaneta americana TaxID=6978 RepID=UPI0037E79A51
MDTLKKRTPDYTDIAYREAVARLRYLLAESYSPHSSPAKSSLMHRADDSGDEIESVALSERSRHQHQHQHQHFLHPYRTPLYGSKRALYADTSTKLPHAHSSQNLPSAAMGSGAGAAEVPETSVKTEGPLPPPELMAFIERQEEYIEQLEKESQYCRDELSALLGKVKEVISENEGLHEREKAGLLKSVFDCFETGDEDDQDMEPEGKQPEKQKTQQNKKKRLEGPSIIFESRISELEAQLTQTKMDLRKALEEADLYKKKLADQPLSYESQGLAGTSDCSSHRQQIESLQREKDELNENLIKLQAALAQFREKEADASLKVKRSLDVVDQAQFEKAQAELEVRRLKDELDRQHEKMRELLQEQGRKVQDERMQLERRYTQQMEQLSTDLTSQWDSSSKLQLELEKQRRVEADLRRDVQQKSTTVEELKKELQNKISSLQSELVQAAVDRGSLEQELAASRLAVERAERDGRQEASRLQAEVAALRQRLDRADADLMHSRRENLRLMEQIASLEREVNLAKLAKESADRSSSSPSKQKTGQREKELAAMVMDMEAKHVQTVAELEGMIQSQNQVMEKLKDECHSLTQRLEESSARHKCERAGLREDNAMLLDKLGRLWEIQKQQRRHLVDSSELAPHQQMTTPTPETPLSHSSMQEQSNTTHSNMTPSSTNLTNPKPVNSSTKLSTNQILVNSTRLTPVSSSTNLNPVNSTTNLNPVNSNTNLNPVSSSTNLNPVNRSTNLNPLSSSTNLNPVNSNTNLNPVNSNTNLNPVNSNTNLNPASSNTNLNPVSNSTSPCPVSSCQMGLTPARFSRPRSLCPHLSLSPRRREVVDPLPPPPPPPPLTLEDLATDSDSWDSPSAQLGIFKPLS